MALKMVYRKFVYGAELTFPDAYIEIIEVFGNKERMGIRVDIYSDESKEMLVDRLSFEYVPDVADAAPNFFKQGYVYIKTLDEFKDAVDVLEEGQRNI